MTKQQTKKSVSSPASPSDSETAALKFSEPLQMDLSNHFLIAMPAMQDPIFGGSVVFLCEHNADGAMGVVINKATDMTMDILLERIDLKLISDDVVSPQISPLMERITAVDIGADNGDKIILPLTKRPVMFGGPVQAERGFVLHSPPTAYSSTVKVSDQVAITFSKDVLEEVAHAIGPERMLVSIGCSSWTPGQLENEIARNDWLTVAADPEIIFGMPIAERFAAAIKLLGIDPYLLSAGSGRA